MARTRTRQEAEFLGYFHGINKRMIADTIDQYRSTGTAGYTTSLILVRILKVKERISSDRRTEFARHHVCNDDQQHKLFACEHKHSQSPYGWMTYTCFKDDYRRQGPSVPGSRLSQRLKKLRNGIERHYGLTKENRYHMEVNNTCKGHDNVLIHVIEHDIVATLDVLFGHRKPGKWSDVLR